MYLSLFLFLTLKLSLAHSVAFTLLVIVSSGLPGCQACFRSKTSVTDRKQEGKTSGLAHSVVSLLARGCQTPKCLWSTEINVSNGTPEETNSCEQADSLADR